MGGEREISIMGYIAGDAGQVRRALLRIALRADPGGDAHVRQDEAHADAGSGHSDVCSFRHFGEDRSSITLQAKTHTPYINIHRACLSSERSVHGCVDGVLPVHGAEEAEAKRFDVARRGKT